MGASLIYFLVCIDTQKHRAYTRPISSTKQLTAPAESGESRKVNIMQNFTINSRKLNKTITFSRPGKSYIFADLNGQPGTLGNQICQGGSTMGSTLSYDGDDQEQFEKICRNWYRSYLRQESI